MCFLNFPPVGEQNVEVHIDLNQGSCAVDGRGSVDASVSVVVESADPSVAQESHDDVSPSRHEDSDFGIEKLLENVVPAVSVVASRVCLASNDFPEVSRVEPHVAEVSKDVAVMLCWIRRNLSKKMYWSALKNNNMKTLTLKARILFRTVQLKFFSFHFV